MIQTVLSMKKHGGISKYPETNMLETNTLRNRSKAEEAIEVLREEMKPGLRDETLYRGISEPIIEDHLREGFFSVTHDKEKAAEYGDVFTVYVAKDVPRMSFTAEGGEMLLIDGMKYTVDAKTNIIRVTVPSAANKNLPYLGSLWIAKKSAKQTKAQQNFTALVEKLYCYSFEEPDEYGIYMGDCEESRLAEIAPLSGEIKLQKLRERLNKLTDLNGFLENISLILDVEETKLRSVVKEVMQGGTRKAHKNKRKTRRVRKSRKAQKGKN